MSDTVDRLKPWSIKAIAPRTTELIASAARREDLTVGQWLEKRVDDWLADGGPIATQAADKPAADLPAVCDLIRVAMEVSRATGKPLRADLQGRLLGLVDQELRSARGMPQRPYRPMPPAQRRLMIDEPGGC